MKASVPSFESQYQPINRDRRKLDFSLRTWDQVAELYTARTGEPMTGKHAEHIHSRAIRKLRIMLARAENAATSELFEAEID